MLQFTYPDLICKRTFGDKCNGKNDLWLNVKGDYIYFTGKIILNLD